MGHNGQKVETAEHLGVIVARITGRDTTSVVQELERIAEAGGSEVELLEHAAKMAKSQLQSSS